MGGTMGLIQQAIEIARARFDEYNHFRFTNMMVAISTGGKLTAAEREDLRSYLG